MLAMTFLMSCFFEKTGTANAFAILWIIGNGLLAFTFYSIMSMKKDQTIAAIMEMLPSVAVFRGIWELSSYADLGVHARTTGMQWSNLNDEGNGMTRVWLISAVEWVVFMLISWAHTTVSSDITQPLSLLILLLYRLICPQHYLNDGNSLQSAKFSDSWLCFLCDSSGKIQICSKFIFLASETG